LPSFFDKVITKPSSDKCNIIRKLIDRNVKLGAISEVPFQSNQFVSRVFSVKKSNGDDRLIIDLSRLNNYLSKVHFSMEGIEVIKSLLEKEDYMASIDLSDAFFSVSIHKDYRRFITFEFEGKRYSYNVLPFGLSASPRIFSKMLRPVIVWLRSQGVKLTAYMDDIFICNSCKSVLSSQLNLILQTLTSLGFRPNLSKSSLVPSKILLHLGFTWNSSQNSISLPDSKIIKTREFAVKIKDRATISLRTASSFLGLLVSLQTGFFLAPLYFRNFQLDFLSSLSLCNSWEDIYTPSNVALQDILWWAKMSVEDTVPSQIWPVSKSATLTTDASLEGWGGILSSGQSVSEAWSDEEKILHINLLELKAVFNSLSHFAPLLNPNSNILVQTDNIAAMHYINKIGGTKSIQMCCVSLEIWKFCESKNIKIEAIHIPGTENLIADFFSRCTSNNHEYYLSDQTFNDLTLMLEFFPKVDLFATGANNKVPRYVSWDYDPFAWKVDAFSFTWPDNVYLFPPIIQINNSVKKIIEDRVDLGLLITPLWPGLPIIPKLVSLLIEDPIIIPERSLQGLRSTRHPFQLVAWMLSTCSERQRVYRRRSEKLCSKALLHQLYHHTTDTGRSFINGLWKQSILPRFLYQ